MSFTHFFSALVLTLAAASVAAGASKGVDAGAAAYAAGDYAAAHAAWEPLARQGDALAQVLLGALYAYGEGVPRDDSTAVRWFRMAAEQGSAQGQYNLAVMYERGWGVEQDAARAEHWYAKAAAQGRGDARQKLDELRWRRSIGAAHSAAPAPTPEPAANAPEPRAVNPPEPLPADIPATPAPAGNGNPPKPPARAQSQPPASAKASVQIATAAEEPDSSEAFGVKPSPAMRFEPAAPRPLGELQVRRQDSISSVSGAAERTALKQTKPLRPGDADSPAGSIPELDERALWLQGQPPGHYTIQLASSLTPAALMAYIDASGIRGSFAVFRSNQGPLPRYSLVYGSYGSIYAAEDALRTLPRAWRRWVPWVREFRGIHDGLAP